MYAIVSIGADATSVRRPVSGYCAVRDDVVATAAKWNAHAVQYSTQ